MLRKPTTAKTREELFWEWFSRHQEKYYKLDGHDDVLFEDLANQLTKVNENLTFELWPLLDGVKKELIITSDGFVSSFPAVVKLVESAPEFANWKIVAFRQPRTGFSSMLFRGIELKFTDVYFVYAKENNKLEIDLHVKGYTPNSNWDSVCYVMLDVLLGEYNVEMLLGSIKMQALNEKKITKLKPISELSKIVRNLKIELSN